MDLLEYKPLAQTHDPIIYMKTATQIKKTKIKNQNYLRFLDGDGILNPINHEHLSMALDNVNKTAVYKREARAMLICLYYTGARPNEVLRMRAKDVTTEDSYIKVVVAAAKRGRARSIYLKRKAKYIMEFWDYASSLFPDMFMFYHYKNEYKRLKVSKKGILKEYIDISDKVRYWIYKWFEGVIENSIPPYYLRHNKFSKLAEKGATDRDLLQIKGARSFVSIAPYIHQSAHSAKKLAKIND